MKKTIVYLCTFLVLFVSFISVPLKAEEQGKASLGDKLFSGASFSLIALQVLDWYTTDQAVAQFGKRVVEGNPFTNLFVQNRPLLFVFKSGLAIGMYFFNKELYRQDRTLAWISTILECGWLSYIVINNISQTEKAEKALKPPVAFTFNFRF